MFHPPCRTTGRKTCHVIVFCQCNFIDLTHTFSSKSYSSFFPHGATLLSLAEISSNFTLGNFIKFGETFLLLSQRDKNNSPPPKKKITDALRRDLNIFMTTLVLNVTTFISLPQTLPLLLVYHGHLITNGPMVATLTSPRRVPLFRKFLTCFIILPSTPGSRELNNSL